MAAFIARAFNYFLSPSKEPRPLPRSSNGNSLTSSKKAKRTSNGDGRSKKSELASVHQGSDMRSKVTKPAYKPSPKKKSKFVTQKWGVARISKVYEQKVLESTEENVTDQRLDDDTFIESAESNQEIKRESDNEDENMTLVDEDSPSRDDGEAEQDANITSIKAKILQADDPRVSDWSDDEIWVFNKLVMRGREPLLPFELAQEYPSWPDILFTNNPSKTIIKPHHCSMANLASALNHFINEGSSARCRIHGAASPEPSILRALKAFHKFILQDARLNLKQNPPLICLIAAAPHEAATHVVQRCQAKMYQSGDAWRQWLLRAQSQQQQLASNRKNSRKGANKSSEGGFAAPLPTIYGFLVKSSILAIMSWDSSLGEEGGVRTLGTYDWNVVGQDVWHALAVGIVEARARRYLMDLEKKGLLGRDREESDPDL